MANEFENLAAELGINLSSTPPSAAQDEPQTEEVSQTEQTEETPVVEEAVEQEDVIENKETESTEVEAEAEEAPVEEPQEILQDETEEELLNSIDDILAEDSIDEDNISDEEYEEMLVGAVSEMLGLEGMTKEALLERLDTEQPTASELDPTVQAIADFVAETGRSVNDWFAYQSSNPSEMDDVTVMKQNLQNQYPDLSEEDAMLLLDNKYKLNADFYGEDEVRLGQLQMKMDATNARKELETTRSKYLAPAEATPQTAAPEEIESPITAEWIAGMEESVNGMEALEFNVGKDKTFSFGMTDSYKSSLKQSQSQLENHFDQYVDESGNWNYELLNVHRTILDNIESIVDSAYKQGVSAGTSNVVKQAVNPSDVTPSSSTSTSSASAEDKVRQQILNALQGGDDTLRMKF
jgi:hypothetical protein